MSSARHTWEPGARQREAGRSLGRPLALAAAGALAVLGAVVLYAPVVLQLVRHWLADENYSHGLVVAPLAAAIAWRRRTSLSSPRPATIAGLAAVLVALALLVAGTRASELYLPRVSGIVLLGGAALLFGGWRALRLAALPLVLLALTIPLPALVFSKLTGSLQQQAATFGARLLDGAGVSVLREGNVLVLPAASIEVVDACSGIRSLFALVSVALLFGHWQRSTPAVRALLVGAVLPLVIAVNALRVAFLGWATTAWGRAALDGWPHTVSGYATVACGVLALYSLTCVQSALARAPRLLDANDPAAV